MGLGQLLHATPGPTKPPGSASGPYRDPGEVERPPVEVAFVPSPNRSVADCDELVPVVRPFKGELPVDEAVAERREIVRLLMLGALFVLSTAGFSFIVRR